MVHVSAPQTGCDLIGRFDEIYVMSREPKRTYPKVPGQYF